MIFLKKDAQEEANDVVAAQTSAEEKVRIEADVAESSSCRSAKEGDGKPV